MKRIELTGTRFGKWLVIGYDKRRSWICRCDCGAIHFVAGCNLRNGNSKACRKCCFLPFGEAAFNDLLSHYVGGAKTREIKWQLTKEDFRTLIGLDCHYCGTAPFAIWPKTRKDLRGTITFNGVDRINSDESYRLENCVSCCRTCNYMKASLSVAEFNIHIRKIYRHSMATKSETA